MTIQELKKCLEENELPKFPLIMVLGTGDRFIVEQYISAILNFSNKQINYISDLSSFNIANFSLFGNVLKSELLYCYKCELYNDCDLDISKCNNLIIVCNKVGTQVAETYKEYIVNIPALDTWQIKEYVYSMADGVDTKYLDWLIEVCKNNIYRLSLECNKLFIFPNQVRNEVFESLLNSGAFLDTSNKTIFDLTNAILRKDINTIKSILINIDYIDVEDLGLVTILIQNFRKLASVWMSNNPTPENTGLTDKQIYAINRLPRTWSATEIVSKIEFLTDLDRRLKSGLIDQKILRDYILINVLN